MIEGKTKRNAASTIKDSVMYRPRKTLSHTTACQRQASRTAGNLQAKAVLEFKAILLSTIYGTNTLLTVSKSSRHLFCNAALLCYFDPCLRRHTANLATPILLWASGFPTYVRDKDFGEQVVFHTSSFNLTLRILRFVARWKNLSFEILRKVYESSLQSQTDRNKI